MRTETSMRAAAGKSWRNRVKDLDLRGNSKTKQLQMLAFAQAYLVTSVAAGVMTMERACALTHQWGTDAAKCFDYFQVEVETPKKRCVDCGAHDGEPCKGDPMHECHLEPDMS